MLKNIGLVTELPHHLISVLDSNPVDEILKITQGFGADIAICANPAAETQNMAVESVRKQGKVVLFGGLPKTDPMTSLNSNLQKRPATVMPQW